MAIMKNTERMDDRLDAIVAAAQAHFTGRTVTTAWKHYRERDKADLAAGVITVISDGESEYSDRLGMAAKEGTQNVILAIQCAVDPKTQTGADLQALELDLAEEAKAFVRAGVAGMSLAIEEINNSRQQSFPYGFVLVRMPAGPVSATTH